jgi:hypothetical protein
MEGGKRPLSDPYKLNNFDPSNLSNKIKEDVNYINVDITGIGSTFALTLMFF